MRKLTLIIFAAVTASAALMAFADQPVTTPAPAVTPAPATAPDSKPASSGAPATAATAPAATPAQKTAAATNDKEKPFEPPLGFRPRMKGGKPVYCRETTPIGTRFTELTCMTEEQLKEYMEYARSMSQDMHQHQAICGSQAACASQ